LFERQKEREEGRGEKGERIIEKGNSRFTILD
jgi:hypothetical protein